MVKLTWFLMNKIMRTEIEKRTEVPFSPFFFNGKRTIKNALNDSIVRILLFIFNGLQQKERKNDKFSK